MKNAQQLIERANELQAEVKRLCSQVSELAKSPIDKTTGVTMDDKDIAISAAHQLDFIIESEMAALRVAINHLKEV